MLEGAGTVHDDVRRALQGQLCVARSERRLVTSRHAADLHIKWLLVFQTVTEGDFCVLISLTSDSISVESWLRLLFA